jgi:hypothetical protein
LASEVVFKVTRVDSSNITGPKVESFKEIAGYRLCEILGAGSFAQTFRAEKDGQQFALKMMWAGM